MLKFLLMTILVFLSVTVMFVSHVFLLTKALQCSYDERIFQMLLPPFPNNLTDNSTATRKEMISRLTRCRFGTFLNDEKFVEVDFTSDCITVSSSDGSVQARGTDFQASRSSHLSAPAFRQPPRPSHQARPMLACF